MRREKKEVIFFSPHCVFLSSCNIFYVSLLLLSCTFSHLSFSFLLLLLFVFTSFLPIFFCCFYLSIFVPLHFLAPLFFLSLSTPLPSSISLPSFLDFVISSPSFSHKHTLTPTTMHLWGLSINFNSSFNPEPPKKHNLDLWPHNSPPFSKTSSHKMYTLERSRLSCQTHTHKIAAAAFIPMKQ